jgi:hypothetical protein
MNILPSSMVSDRNVAGDTVVESLPVVKMPGRVFSFN